MIAKTFDPARYWDRRYRDGRTSGAGSEGTEGAYKAKVVSDLTSELGVTSVIDWGCGDGQVLELVKFPEGTSYLGVDVSPTIVARMREMFGRPYRFITADEYRSDVKYEMAISMDVLFHFPDDSDYTAYLDKLFGSTTRFVLIYATNYDGGLTARHVRRRKFTPDIEARFPEWSLMGDRRSKDPMAAEFFLYNKGVPSG